MAFGNKMGVKVEHNMDPRDLFAPAFGDLIAEVEDGQVGNLQISYTVIGEVTDKSCFEYSNVEIGMDEAFKCLDRNTGKSFCDKIAANSDDPVEEKLFHTSDVHICSHKSDSPAYLYLSFRGPTVNMTVRGLLSARAQR